VLTFVKPGASSSVTQTREAKCLHAEGVENWIQSPECQLLSDRRSKRDQRCVLGLAQQALELAVGAELLARDLRESDAMVAA